MPPHLMCPDPACFRRMIQARYWQPRFDPDGIQTHDRLTDPDLDRVMILASGLYSIASRARGYPGQHTDHSLLALQRALKQVGIHREIVAVHERDLHELAAEDFDMDVLDNLYNIDLCTDEYMIMPEDLMIALAHINQRHGHWAKDWERHVGLVWRYADLLAWTDPSDTTIAARRQTRYLAPYLASHLFLGVSTRDERLYVVTR